MQSSINPINIRTRKLFQASLSRTWSSSDVKVYLKDTILVSSCAFPQGALLYEGGFL